MGNYRTTSLFRFSKDFESLQKVLKNGIYPNYCEEDLSFANEEFIIGIPMISFCDIPITLLDEHTSRYGVYGIGLSKAWGIKRGVTPVMYIANDAVLRSAHYHIMNDFKLTEMVNSKEFKDKMLGETIIKSLPLDMYAKKLNAQLEHDINTYIVGYMKKYEGKYKGKQINNYEENEWRFIVSDTKETKWMWTKNEYDDWRFPKGKKNDVPKPKPTESLIRYQLTFTPSDVKYILVKNLEFKIRTIEYIKTLKTFGSKDYELTEEDKLDLITKIITIEQVKEDF